MFWSGLNVAEIRLVFKALVGYLPLSEVESIPFGSTYWEGGLYVPYIT